MLAASGQPRPRIYRALQPQDILKPLVKAHLPEIETMRQKRPLNPRRPDHRLRGLIAVDQQEGGLAVALAATTNVSLWDAISMAVCMWRVSE